MWRQLYISELEGKHVKADLFRVLAKVRLSSNLQLSTPATSKQKCVELGYGLQDCGASENFVAPHFLRKLEKHQLSGKVRAGNMKVATATDNDPESMPRWRVRLHMVLGRFRYTSWFTVFDLGTYDFILGKTFLKDINLRHLIDHEKNVMTIWGKNDIQKDGSQPRQPQELWIVKGLSPEVKQNSLGERGGAQRRQLNGDKVVDNSFEAVAFATLELELLMAEEFEELPEDTRKQALLVYLKRSDDTKAASPAKSELPTVTDPNVIDVLRGKDKLFGTPVGQPPLSREKFHIQLYPDSQPRFKQSYRVSPSEDLELRKQLLTALENNWIDVSSSQWASPVLFVPKKNGKMRMCIDYRGLNSDTVRNRYPLPNMEDLIDSLWQARVFTKLDLSSGYHQMSVDPADRPKTAFSTKYGLFQWNVLPFGLCNAPSAFMRMMNSILEPHMREFVVVYLDDILIFSQTKEQHKAHVEEILQLLLKHQLKLGADKCSWFQSRVEFVGFWIDEKGVHTSDDKVKVINEWPVPQNVTEVKGFLGLTGFYRKFVSDYAELAIPLYDLTKSSTVDGKNLTTSFVWNDDANKAFVELKRRITLAPALMLPRPGQPLLLRCDASGFALGAVLMQLDDDAQERVVAFHSRKFSPAEMRYPAYDRELLAITDSMLHWRVYLHGATTMVYTDHSSIRHVLKQATLTNRQIGYLAKLQEFDFDVKYWPGAKNKLADALSRRADYQPVCCAAEVECQPVVVEVEPQPVMDVEGFKSAYHSDDYFGPVLKVMAAEKGLARSELIAQFGTKVVNRRDLFHVNDGLLFWQIADKPRKICVPQQFVSKVLHDAHDSPVGGHFGAGKTYARLSHVVFIPRLYTVVSKYVRSCSTCLRTKSTKGTFGLLKPLPYEEGRWTRIGIDFITKLPLTTQGNDTIVTIVDHMSKRVHWFPTNEKIDAKDFAVLFFDNYVRYHGLPSRIVSDRDVRFTSTFWRELMGLMKVELTSSSPFHPQTDGAAEKANAVLVGFLRAFVTSQPQWDLLLSLAEFAYNSSVQESIGMTPFELDLGWKPRGPLDVVACVQDVGGRLMTGSGFVAKLQDVMLHAKTMVEKAQLHQEQMANRFRKKHDFESGDLVLLSTAHLPATYANATTEPSNRKLQHKWVGPFKILRMKGENAAELELSPNLGIHPVQNVEYLRKDTSTPHLNEPTPPPLRQTLQGSKIHEVENILDHSVSGTNKAKMKYLVSWKGFAEDHNEWLSEKELKNCDMLLVEYKKKHGIVDPKKIKRIVLRVNGEG